MKFGVSINHLKIYYRVLTLFVLFFKVEILICQEIISIFIHEQFKKFGYWFIINLCDKHDWIFRYFIEIKNHNMRNL